jgi:hypothetical protein
MQTCRTHSRLVAHLAWLTALPVCCCVCVQRVSEVCVSRSVQTCRRAEPTTDCMFFSTTSHPCLLLLLCLQRVSEVHEQQCADVQTCRTHN